MGLLLPPQLGAHLREMSCAVGEEQPILPTLALPVP
jgi:hypothetical protein